MWVCSHDRNYEEIQIISGQHEEVKFEGKIGIKGAVDVVQYGTGCYTVYKGRKFKGELFQLTSTKIYI